MEKQILPGLRTTFLIHLILGAIFGILYLLIPEGWGNLIGWPMTDATPYRLIGAAILAFSTSSWLAYNETAWDRVRIVVEMEIVWTILGTLVMLGGLFFAALPAIGWLNVVILGGFAITFGFFYFREAPVVLRQAHR
jgi:hypothetical protein